MSGAHHIPRRSWLDAYRELSCQVRALSCGKRLTARIFGNIQVHVRNKQCLSLPLRIFAPWRLCVNCSLLQARISHAKAQSRKEKPQSTTLPKNQHSNPPFRRGAVANFQKSQAYSSPTQHLSCCFGSHVLFQTQKSQCKADAIGFCRRDVCVRLFDG